MKNNQLTIRDLFAVPFWIIGNVFLLLSVVVGGKWTSEIVILHFGKQDYEK